MASDIPAPGCDTEAMKPQLVVAALVLLSGSAVGVLGYEASIESSAIATTTRVATVAATAQVTDAAQRSFTDRMGAVIGYGSLGGASGRLSLSRAEGPTSGGVFLGGIPIGEHDVVGFCSGLESVRLTALPITGGSRAALGTTEISCGATARMHLTTSTAGIRLQAEAISGSGAGVFGAFVVEPGWQGIAR